MSLFTLREAAALIPGAEIAGAADITFDRISTDSRAVKPGDLFVALKGEHFDAHDFLAEAAARGAAAALVTRCAPRLRLPMLIAPDTRAALGALARGQRRKFTLPLVLVTGSSGKTTVKEMIASIFAAAVGGNARLATPGNFNNEIGLPLTLLGLNAAHRFAVIELGMNHPGETAVLAEIAAPTIALITNAQREHQAFMKDVDTVAREHAHALDALPEDGIAVLPACDAYAQRWREAAGARRIFDFALAADEQALHTAANDGPRGVKSQRNPITAVRGALRADDRLTVSTALGGFTCTLRALGAHNAHNALAATAAALAAGVELAAVRAGLESFEPIAGRLAVKVACAAPLTGAMVLDDSYNAHPDSMRAAIDVLAARAAPRILVMGEMGEMGARSEAFHREVGAYARAHHIDALYALGEAARAAVSAFGAGAEHFDSAGALVEHLLQAALDARATILVKGSRFMKMERIVAALTANAVNGTGAQRTEASQ